MMAIATDIETLISTRMSALTTLMSAALLDDTPILMRRIGGLMAQLVETEAQLNRLHDAALSSGSEAAWSVLRQQLAHAQSWTHRCEHALTHLIDSGEGNS